ncbi:hypothetical protein [Myxococcus sp. Y35]|uniref:hypothetical protein n=1 Tax=Pseudomyxococcus flavus TaxID=3115648 RepID=UPI003CF4AFE4
MKTMGFKKTLLPVSLTLAMVGLVGCGPEMEGMPEEGAPTEHEVGAGVADDASLGTTEQAILGSADIACGREASFPTWSFWGETTLDMTNLNPGTVIKARYQAGVSGGIDVDVDSFRQVKGRFGGFAVTVTVLGYTQNGVYTGCLHNTENPGSPTLRVQAY